MRADAMRRRAALIFAARKLFAEHGSEVALETVATEAGVGIATLYRNFESRAQLLDHVALSILSEVHEATLRAESVAAGEERSHEAWVGLVDDLVALDLGALTQALAVADARELSAEVRDQQSLAVGRLDALLRTLSAAGVVREDLRAQELVVALAVVTRPQPDAIVRALPGIRAKVIAMLVDGMRPEGAPALVSP
ncbi:TetR/AcrR family transcriptional regulator [Nocardioides yefusunii]|uniref:TetR/AcrR family transcriptional regulator n=1 Tax=Nocardioides yefusunii TaxID=2500546 RepID=A0ABW1QYQ3_9ACTN|nr:TetR/AcrR family transcriptional regulator [Nocardioides yefusunii]